MPTKTKNPPKISPPDRDVPVLQGWLTSEQAGQILGVTRAAIHSWIQQGVFATQHAVGDRPLYVVREEEVLRLQALHGAASGYRAWSEATRELMAEADTWRRRTWT